MVDEELRFDCIVVEFKDNSIKNVMGLFINMKCNYCG